MVLFGLTSFTSASSNRLATISSSRIYYKMKIVLIITLLSLIAIGSSLKCYQGSSTSTKPTECLKAFDTCQSFTAAGVTVKSCSTKAVCDKACEIVKTGSCSCCQTDGCNGGVATRLSTVALLAPLAATIKFIFYSW